MCMYNYMYMYVCTVYKCVYTSFLFLFIPPPLPPPHQPKYNLLKEVVEVIGTERALQFFRETAELQESGGVLSSDRDKK